MSVSVSSAFGSFAFGISPFGGPAPGVIIPPFGTPTAIPPVTASQFRDRLARSIPTGWAGEDALQSGLAADFLTALGGQLSEVVGEIQYTALATRLTTETSPELDNASLDFFGGALPRPSSMSDSAFAQLIISSLFKTAATRPAIANALLALTGTQPRMLEPWNIFDTGVWDRISYWDYDDASNPARWAGVLSYQGFVETPTPAVPAIGPNNPILCWDDSAYWNVPGYFFGNISVLPVASVDSIINSLRAAGITVWVKLLVPPTPPTGLVWVAQGSGFVTIRWSVSSQGSSPVLYTLQYQAPGGSFLSGPITAGTSVTVSGLVSGVLYTLRVVARNAAGQSAPSATITASPL